MSVFRLISQYILENHEMIFFICKVYIALPLNLVREGEVFTVFVNGEWITLWLTLDKNQMANYMRIL